MFKVLKSSSPDLVFCVMLFLLISPAVLCAQSSSKHPKPTSRSEVAAPKLTPEQKRGLGLLQAAEAESAALQPDMHAFVLWRASYAYTKLDPKQAEKLSGDAFTATQAMEDASDNDHCAAPGGITNRRKTCRTLRLSSRSLPIPTIIRSVRPPTWSPHWGRNIQQIG